MRLVTSGLKLMTRISVKKLLRVRLLYARINLSTTLRLISPTVAPHVSCASCRKICWYVRTQVIQGPFYAPSSRIIGSVPNCHEIISPKKLMKQLESESVTVELSSLGCNQVHKFLEVPLTVFSMGLRECGLNHSRYLGLPWQDR